MPDRPPEPLDLSRLQTCSLADRPSLVSAEHVGRVPTPNPTIADWLNSLPRFLAATGLRQARDRICKAHGAGRTIVAAMGAHVIKVGCGPYLVDWLERGVLSALAVNGAFAVHDVELALVGKTSEDVATRLPEGSFGMARETADLYARAAQRGSADGVGLGRAIGLELAEADCRCPEASVLAAAARLDVPCTVHVAVGTDVVHMHPGMDGAALGSASLADFRLLASVVAGLEDGVWLNIGSAVLLPEVFLKCVSMARNLGRPLDRVTTVNMDMIQHYRPRVNVLGRPASLGIAITGHHEIMVPLLHAAVAAALNAKGNC